MRVVLVGLVVACGANTPPADQPGPPGTWTCKQIVESCDSMCRTGMCLQACSSQGDQNGGSLHAALIQCAAANRCYDDRCTRALCGSQVDACIADTSSPMAATGPAEHVPPPPDQHVTAPPPPPPDDPKQTATDPEPAKSDASLTTAAVTGDWSYGAKTAITTQKKSGTGSGGLLHLASDGRFERATNVETSDGKCKTDTFTYQIGAWKLEGGTLVLSVKEATASLRDSCHKAKNYDREDAVKDERRAIRMPDAHELAITDDAGELQSYKKK